LNPPRLLAGVLFLTIGLCATFLIHTLRTSPRIHDVKQGESLYSIAKEYYGDGNLYAAIARKNGLTEPYVLKPGARLFIPSPTGVMDFSMLLAAIAIFTALGFTVDIPAFSAAERLLGGSGNNLRAFTAAATSAFYSAALLLWCMAIWGIAGKTGVLLALPIVWLATGALRIQALTPVYKDDIKRTALTWGIAKTFSMCAMLLILLIGTALTGEKMRPVLNTLSMIAPR